jgi:dipeptidyl aminopeptidase/acylaminoacyl peptidase
MRQRIMFLVFTVWITAACTSADAQTEIKGVAFDSTPIELSDVPQSTPRPINSMDLLTIRDLHGVQISPDGKSVAFVVGQAIYETNSYRSGLFVVGTSPSSVPISLGTAGPPRWDLLGDWASEAPQWSRDSRYIAYRLLTDGRWQIWRWNRDGSEPTQLTHAPYDVQSFEWSGDGRKITFVVKKPISADEIERIQEHGILYDGETTVFDNKPIVQQELTRRSEETETWTHDIASGTERKLSSAEQEQAGRWKQKLGDKIVDIDRWASGDFGNIIEPKLSPDGKKAVFRLWNSPPVSGHPSQPLYLKILDGGPATPLDPGVYWVTDYWWSADGKEIYFAEASGDGRAKKLLVASANGGNPRQLSPDTREFLDEYSVDSDGRFAACVRENNTTPGQVALLDLQTGALHSLVNVNPQFKNLRLSPATRIEWVSKYGEPGHGYLVKPLNSEDGKRYPLIVTTYNAGDYFLRGGTGDEYPIQVFAANGFAVLAWDQGRREADAKDGDFEQAMLRFRSPMASLDAALKTLQSMGIVDPARNGLTGYSFGTEITEFTISHSQLFQAAIACGGGGDSPYFYYMAPKYWKKEYVKWGMGGWPEGESSKRWHEYSSALNAPLIHAPFLSNASEDDFMMTFDLYTSLEQLRKPVELFMYPNELHTKVQPKHRYEIYERNLDWFKFWFQGKEDSGPAKKGQYDRWRKLRELHEEDMKKQDTTQTVGSGE